MDIVEKKSQQSTNTKTYDTTLLTLNNRKTLNLTGVEKVFEANQTKVQLQVAGSVLSVAGQNLNITKLDVEKGEVQIDGIVDELKFSNQQQKTNFFKKMFK